MPFLGLLSWKAVGGFAFKALPIILVVGVFLYAFLIVIPSNNRLKDELETAKQQNVEMEERFAKYEENVNLLNSGVGAQITIRTEQSELQGRVRDVEVESIDEPFLDPGMQRRADILRSYQKNSPIFDGAN